VSFLGKDPDPIQKNTFHPNREETVYERTISAVLERSLRLATEIDCITPGHRFGFPKHQHAIDLSDKAEHWGKLEGLDSHQTGILKVLLACHDIGRPLEAIKRLQSPNDTSIDHGELGAEYLITSGVLNLLQPEDAALIVSAARQHNKKIVTLTGRELDFCYYLRDLDKLEILASEQYSTPKGILTQIKLHYLSPEEGARLPESEALNIIQEVLSGNDSIVFDQNPLSQKVYQIMADAPLMDHEAIKAIEFRRQAELSSLKQSWCSYMLLHVAMIFDTKSDFALREVLELGLLEKRMNFIKSRLDEELYLKIDSIVTDFLGQVR